MIEGYTNMRYDKSGEAAIMQKRIGLHVRKPNFPKAEIGKMCLHNAANVHAFNQLYGVFFY